MAKKLYYKIGEACKILGIEAYVLRYWETEFPFLTPSKSRSGQRVYGEDELGLIRRIKELLYEEGYTIAGAKRKLEAELESGIPAASGNAVGEVGTASATVAAGDPPANNAAAVAADPAPVLDTAGAEEIQRLRSGIELALQQARDVLRLLDASA